MSKIPNQNLRIRGYSWIKLFSVTSKKLFVENYKTIQKWFLILPVYIWFLVLLFVPFLIIFAISISEYALSVPPFNLFIHKISSGDWVVSPSWSNFQILFEDKFYIKSYFISLRLALITTLCTLLIGYPIALGISQSKPSIKSFLLLCIVLPFWTSLVIRAYAWNIILGDSGLLNKLLLNLNIIDVPMQIMNSETAVVIGMVYCYLPFMVLPLFIAIDKVDKSIIEASLDLGCTPFRSFLRITLPLSFPGIVAGLMLVFIPAVGEFIIPDLLGGNKVLTVGKVIWSEFFYNRDWPVASAITVVLAITFIIPVAVIQKVVSRRN